MTEERNREICERHRSGESYRKLAAAYGVSNTRIAQIVRRARRNDQREKAREVR